MPTRILIADENINRRYAVIDRLALNAEIHECSNREGLLRVTTNSQPAVVVIGALGGPGDGIESAHIVRHVHPSAKVILIADVSSEGIAIGALRAGVFEYLIAPVAPIDVAEAISRAVPNLDEERDGFEDLVGASEPMRRVRDLIWRIAPLNSTTLITGESGTGKEIVARLIHQHSRRSKAPYVCVNCAALPDSLVESELFGHERGAFTGAITRHSGQMANAHRGTLFLDEIGDMSNTAQSKMLRALEQHEIQPLGSAKPVPIDVRVITATHCHLEELIAEGKFRQDLYYRLDVSRIHLPPLRERVQDIPVLALHFVRMMNRTHGRRLVGLTQAALTMLARHDWPGNVRQLRNVIEAAAGMASSEWITDADLRASHTFSVLSPPPLRTRATAYIETKQVRLEKDALVEALKVTHWNMTKAAEMLHWSRSTIYRRMAQYGISRAGSSREEEGADEPLDLPSSIVA